MIMNRTKNDLDLLGNDLEYDADDHEYDKEDDEGANHRHINLKK